VTRRWKPPATTRIVAIFLDDYHVRETNSLRVRRQLVAFIENELRPRTS
jgi:hypothetical protein